MAVPTSLTMVSELRGNPGVTGISQVAPGLR